MTIRKPRPASLQLLTAEAALRRISSSHPKYPFIELDLRKAKAGVKGEKSVAHFLSLINLTDKFVYHNLRLKRDDQHHFELDTLIISPHYLLIIEVKYFSGEWVELREYPNQLTQFTYEQTRRTYEDPILQVKEQRKNLANWLVRRNLPSLPIEYLVIMPNSSCELRFHENYKEYKRVIRLPSLEQNLISFDTFHKRSSGIPKSDINLLDERLLAEHCPPASHGITRYALQEDEIKKGIHCPQCRSIPMIRKKCTWHCPFCDYFSSAKIPGRETLMDYFLLVNDTINNRQVRDFCLVDTPRQARNLLRGLNLEYCGSTKGRVYLLRGLFDLYDLQSEKV
ncbi:nuclease-related domain-containing protein [Alteribacter natronophilus]|uniref:nuclease-related domain-containing protein n=1 Tax=Alteribacter natronophilus TaxID=2583810 RepID=UPI00110EB460|nr:nuclease-related domain-containing protein [Alteribacter natronophilus]TMW72204.1 NERD domain-containing protein [Alteribacter natronophilus]